jgi:hypothetical protein
MQEKTLFLASCTVVRGCALLDNSEDFTRLVKAYTAENAMEIYKAHLRAVLNPLTEYPVKGSIRVTEVLE